MKLTGSPLALCLLICTLLCLNASARKSTRRVRSSKRLNVTAGASKAQRATSTETLQAWTSSNGQKCELRRICAYRAGDLPTDATKPKDFKNKAEEKNDGKDSLTKGGAAHFDLAAAAEKKTIVIPGELDSCYTLVFPPNCPPEPEKAGPKGCATYKKMADCVLAPVAPAGCQWFEALGKMHDKDSKRQNYLGEAVLQKEGIKEATFIELGGDDKKKETKEEKEEDPHHQNAVEVDEPSEGVAMDQEYIKNLKFNAHDAYCTAKTGYKDHYLADVHRGAVEAGQEIEEVGHAIRDNAG